MTPAFYCLIVFVATVLCAVTCEKEDEQLEIDEIMLAEMEKINLERQPLTVEAIAQAKQ
jgi:hypothetical protein